MVKKLLFFTIILAGCNNDAQVVFYDTSIKNKNIPCLKLSIFPPNKHLEQQVTKLYHFSKECNYTLVVSKKSGIICNSNYNVEKKNINGFPNSYLTLSIKKDFKTLYSYYKDLNHDVRDTDVKNSFIQLREDLKLQN